MFGSFTEPFSCFVCVFCQSSTVTPCCVEFAVIAPAASITACTPARDARSVNSSIYTRFQIYGVISS